MRTAPGKLDWGAVREQMRLAIAGAERPTPANLARVQELLAGVAETMREVAAQPAAERAAWGNEIYALRRDLLRVSALLDSCAGYYAGWERRMATLTAGYTSRGTPGAPRHDAHLLLEA